jgi:predicted metal-dependent hydrolase
MNSTADYDPRYLAGVLFFNERDFFEAHEVWEDIWTECSGTERSFYQGLIQAAVGLLHFSRGNFRGAVKLYHSARRYLEACPAPYHGFDRLAFWPQMEACFAKLLTQETPDAATRPDEAHLPTITLDPPPESWPNLEDFLSEEEAS